MLPMAALIKWQHEYWPHGLSQAFFLRKSGLVSATFRAERSSPASGALSLAILSWRAMRLTAAAA
jgi:hypothetical protein